MAGCGVFLRIFFVQQKAAYEMRISDWSSDVCSSDLPGVRYMEVNASGRPVRELSREPAVPGRDITTTLDLGLQETVMRRLSAERQAAAVVVNVENGDILALASTPSLDRKSTRLNSSH